MIFAGAARATGGRVLEIPAIADAEPIIDRQHHEAAAGQILVQRIGVGIIAHGAEAEQHLARRAAVHEHHGRALAGRAGGPEQLAVDGGAIGRFPCDFFRHHHGGPGEIRRCRLPGQRGTARRAPVHCACIARAGGDQRHAIIGGGRSPFQPGAAGDRPHWPARNGNRKDMAAGVVIRCRPGVGRIIQGRPIRAERHMFDHETIAGQPGRSAATGRHRVQLLPVAGGRQEHQPIAGRPVQIGAACHIREAVAQSRAAGPGLPRRTGGGIGNHDRPQLRFKRQEPVRAIQPSPAPGEGDTLAVRRPGRAAIDTAGGLHIGDRQGRPAKDADQGMAFAARDIGEAAAIG